MRVMVLNGCALGLEFGYDEGDSGTMRVMVLNGCALGLEFACVELLMDACRVRVSVGKPVTILDGLERQGFCNKASLC